MSRKEKLLEQLKNNPNDATFADIRKLLEQEGFLLERITGSHHIFRKDAIVFVVPVHKKRVKSVYVRRVVAIIEDMHPTRKGL
jgi:predicted RNA binding protein YcfA (HicA-like mRNA interferase family)